jgi:hypothetical protein
VLGKFLRFIVYFVKWNLVIFESFALFFSIQGGNLGELLVIVSSHLDCRLEVCSSGCGDEN